MATNSSAESQDDADPSSLVQKTAKHGDAISSLTHRVDVMECRMKDTNSFAEYIIETHRTSAVFQTFFKDKLTDLIKTDDSVKKVIECKVKESDRNFAWAKARQVGGWVIIFFTLIVGIIGREIAQWIASLITHATK